MFESITHPRKRAFLAAYSKCANVTRSAKIAGISRELHYDWKAQDDEYAAAFETAGQLGGDFLEDQAVNQATRGTVEYVVYKGEVVEYAGKPVKKRHRSEKLLMFLLSGVKPHKYKQRVANEHSGPNGAPLGGAHIDLSALTDAELDELERLAIKAESTQPGRSQLRAGETEAEQAGEDVPE